MVTKKAAKSGSKLGLKKETIKDLDVKRKGALVRGGTGGTSVILPQLRVNPIFIAPPQIRQK